MTLPKNLSELLASHRRDQPDALAFRFLEGGTDERTIRYADLDGQAGAVAACLRQTAAPGDKVLLLFPPGLDNVVALCACFHAGLTAVPAYPPEPDRLDRTLPRLLDIMRDAGATVVLGSDALIAAAAALQAAMPELGALRWLALSEARATGAYLAEEGLEPTEVALLQYTSGSTSKPRGVMLTHRNLIFNSESVAVLFGHGPSSRPVIWLPPFHDMGLIGGIIQPLFLGVPGTLLSPLTVLARPLLWLQAIDRFGGTTSGGPDFGYRLCVRRVRHDECEGLDLSSWTLAFNGSEPVRHQTMEAFRQTFAPYGFHARCQYPCYGLAEHTLIATGGDKEAEPVVRAWDVAGLEAGRAEPPAEAPGRPLVGCGGPAPGHAVRIVDPDSRMVLADRAIGEIWLAGPSVAAGYHDRPELTERLFEAFTVQQPGGPAAEGPFLRTRDLGFVDEGELFITGRIKDLMIIRGRNVHPHDVERCAEAAHEGLRPGCSAAFTVHSEASGQPDMASLDERLVTVFEVRPGEDRHDEIVQAVRRSIATEQSLQVQAVVLLPARTIPKTSSGKIQRALTRRRFEKGALRPVHVWSLLAERSS